MVAAEIHVRRQSLPNLTLTLRVLNPTPWNQGMDELQDLLREAACP